MKAMMEDKTAEKFTACHDWFQRFYVDLAGLLDAISEQLEVAQYVRSWKQDVSKKSWPFAPTVQGGYFRFPDPMFVSYECKSKDAIDSGLPVLSIVSVLSQKALSGSSNIKQQRAKALLAVLRHQTLESCFRGPMLVVFLHDQFPAEGSSKVEELKFDAEEESFNGKLAFGGKKKRFTCFLVPLDAFSEDHCRTQKPEAVIAKEIVGPLNDLLNRWPKEVKGTDS